MLSYDCPENASADELDSCTVWQGVIYAVDSSGNVKFLPGQGEAAPKFLIMADLAFDLIASDKIAKELPKTFPSDIFELSGCQE